MPQTDQDKSFQHDVLEIDFSPKTPIHCVLSATESRHASVIPSLIFTHGAGGTLQSPGIANFVNGFATESPILCFQGNMNLKSRTKMFTAVVEDQKAPQRVGGRSMGARAAIMAVSKDTTHLVLVSYPLHTNTEVRDRLLLDLPARLRVIFVSGDKDAMCKLSRLEDVRRKMKCHTWRLVVEGADHGMNVKPKPATECVGEKVGEVVSSWLQCHDEKKLEASISWDPDATIARFSGWSSGTLPADDSHPKDPPDQATDLSPAHKFKPDPKARTTGNDGSKQEISSRSSKRQRMR